MTLRLQKAGGPADATDAEKRQIYDDMQRAVPTALSTSQTLVRNTHANLDLEVLSSSPITLTLPPTTDCVVGDEFMGINNGSGQLTILNNGGGAVVGSALLPSTVSQYEGFLVRCTSAGFRRLA